MVKYVTLKSIKEALPYEVPPSQHPFMLFRVYCDVPDLYLGCSELIVL